MNNCTKRKLPIMPTGVQRRWTAQAPSEPIEKVTGKKWIPEANPLLKKRRTNPPALGPQGAQPRANGQARDFAKRTQFRRKGMAEMRNRRDSRTRIGGRLCWSSAILEETELTRMPSVFPSRRTKPSHPGLGKIWRGTIRSLSRSLTDAQVQQGLRRRCPRWGFGLYGWCTHRERCPGMFAQIFNLDAVAQHEWSSAEKNCLVRAADCSLVARGRSWPRRGASVCTRAWRDGRGQCLERGEGS